MLRNLIDIEHKGVDVTYKAHADLQRGMGVIKSTGGLTGFISAAGTAGIFLVDKEPIDGGLDAAWVIRPDYSPTYELVKTGEFCKLIPYVKGEQFATDQVTGTPAEGDYIEWGTDGKAVVAGSDTPYICRGIINDCGKVILYRIEVVA